MASLELDYDQLMQAVGHDLGFGTDWKSWSDAQKYQADDIAIQGGLRKFYAPEPVGKMPPVQWAFLRPVRQLSLVSAVADYDLPADCDGVIGPVTILTSTGCYGSLHTVNEGIIRKYRSTNAISTGIPAYCAVRAKVMNQGFPQGWEMLIFPTPDAAYTIQFKQTVKPQRLSPENPYPYGGMQHSQTILAACLSEGEQKVRDIQNGPHAIEFARRLQASVALDGQQGRGERLGYAGDPSTPECYRLRRGGYGNGVWTTDTESSYNGTIY